jgi:predicted membrane-bound dolichyl-phosphate-mannose-protein mannosyltransferase
MFCVLSFKVIIDVVVFVVVIVFLIDVVVSYFSFLSIPLSLTAKFLVFLVLFFFFRVKL